MAAEPALRPVSRLNFRQHDADPGAAADIAVYGDMPLVAFNDTLDNGESQTAAMIFGGEKWVKDFLGILGRDAFAGVLKLDFYAFIVGTGGGADH